MISRLKYASFSLLFISSLGQAQIEQLERNFETENTAAAAFYLKSLTNPIEHALFEAELFFLEGNYKKSREILLLHKNQFTSNREKGKFHLLMAMLDHKQQNYPESIKGFELAEKLFEICKPKDNLLAQLNYWRGYALLEQKKLELSEQNLLSALKFYQQDSLRFFTKNAKLYFWLGTVKNEEQDFDSSIYFLKRALRTFENTPLDKTREIVKIHNNLGNSYAAIWSYNEAVNNYQKAIQLNKDKIGDPIELANACSNLGLFYNTFENHLQSEYWFNQAFLWMQKSNIDPIRRTMILQNYGACLANRYEFQEALSTYFQALQIVTQYKEDRGDIYTQLLLNIATAYSNLDLASKAEPYKAMANEFFIKNKGKWPNEYNAWRLWEAISLRQNGNLETSLKILQELEIYYSKINTDKFFEVEKQKAICFNNLKQYAESRKYYDQLLIHFKKLFPDSHPQIIYLLNDLGSLFVKEKQYDSAGYYFRLAKQNNQLASTEIKSNQLYASKIEWIVSNYYLHMIDQKKFTTGQLSVEELQQSEGLIYSTLSVIESKRIEFRNDQDITNLYRMTRDFFDEAMKYYFTLYNHTGDKQYIDKAFFISEKSKYQTLQNAIKLDRVNAFAGVTSKIMAEEQKLVKQVAQLEYQYSQELAKQEEPLPELVQEYITQWRTNSNRHNELVDSIKNNLPDYYNLKFNRSTTEIHQIQNSFLSNNQDMAWVSYYVGESESYAIAITHNDKYFIKLDGAEKITRQLKSFNNYVSHQMNRELQQASFELYKGLFQAVDSCFRLHSKKIKKVVIIPDGPLNYLNFELLGKPVNKSWHYALYDYQFSYGYSSTLLWTEFSDQQKWNVNTTSMVGFAPEFVRGSGPLMNESTREGSEKPGYDSFDFSPLQKNQDEVVQVAEILKQKKIKTAVFLGPQADEASFKKANLGSYNIIHLATHGFVSNQSQNVAGIAFAKNQNSSDDGILYMDEIFSLKNKANLVCLSACETGSGIFQEGEGLVGLTRAFIYSGAQNLVVSLWKVQDESTAQLMTHFYSALVKNHSVSQSLHDAKIAMIKKNPTLPPYHWSAFVHVGLN